MRKVFWDNPYQYSLTTKVASIDGNQIVPEENGCRFFCERAEQKLDAMFYSIYFAEIC